MMNEWIFYSGIPNLQLWSKGKAFPMGDQELKFYFRISQGDWTRMKHLHTTHTKFENYIAEF